MSGKITGVENYPSRKKKANKVTKLEPYIQKTIEHRLREEEHVGKGLIAAVEQ